MPRSAIRHSAPNRPASRRAAPIQAPTRKRQARTAAPESPEGDQPASSRTHSSVSPAPRPGRAGMTAVQYAPPGPKTHKGAPSALSCDRASRRRMLRDSCSLRLISGLPALRAGTSCADCSEYGTRTSTKRQGLCSKKIFFLTISQTCRYVGLSELRSTISSGIGKLAGLFISESSGPDAQFWPLPRFFTVEATFGRNRRTQTDDGHYYNMRARAVFDHRSDHAEALEGNPVHAGLATRLNCLTPGPSRPISRGSNAAAWGASNIVGLLMASRHVASVRSVISPLP